MSHVTLSDDEVRQLLRWANGCDRESYLGTADWPLIERLAGLVGEDPADIAPHEAQDRETAHTTAHAHPEKPS